MQLKAIICRTGVDKNGDETTQDTLEILANNCKDIPVNVNFNNMRIIGRVLEGKVVGDGMQVILYLDENLCIGEKVMHFVSKMKYAIGYKVGGSDGAPEPMSVGMCEKAAFDNADVEVIED